MSSTFNFNKPTDQLLELGGVFYYGDDDLDELVVNEPMIYSADWEFARKNGGKLTNAVMDSVMIYNTGSLNNFIIDTRVQMLMPGQYPSIPGFHCDNYPRQYGQPILRNDHKETHFICIVGTQDHDEDFLIDREISPTLFIENNLTLEYDPRNVWASVSKNVKKNRVVPRYIESCKLYRFGSSALHTSTEAKYKGWRFFFRATSCNPKKTASNQIRNQVQVYTTFDGGW